MAQSSQESYELIDRKRGLPHNIVLSLLQDKEGLLWIGTYSGLCLYDGARFIKFDQLAGDSNKTASQPIETIFEDRDNNIWIGTRYGFLGFYSKKNKRFTPYHVDQATSINIFFQNNAGVVWFVNANGVIGEVRGNKASYHHTTLKQKIFVISEKSADTLLLLGARGLYAYSINRDQAAWLPLHQSEQYNWNVSATISGNEFYTINHCGWHKITSEGNVVKDVIQVPHYFKSYTRQRLVQNNNGNIYYTDGSVIEEYRTDGQLVKKFHISEHEYEELSNETINTMQVDRSGIIWIGTNSGLYKVDVYKYQFGKYTQNSKSKKISRNYVRSVFIDEQENLWVGTHRGEINQLVYNRQKDHYVLKNTYPVRFHDSFLSESITNSLLQLRNGILLAGTQQALFYFDRKEEVFTTYLPAALSDLVVEIWCLYEDKYGRIWIGTNGKGLFIFDPAAKKLHHYEKGTAITNMVSGSAVWNIYESSDGTVWLGTNNGLCRVRQTGDLQNMRFERTHLDTQHSVQVWSFAEDKSNNLWVGTTGNGIYMLKYKSNKIIHYNDIGNNVVSSMFFDSNETLWFGSVNGLYHYDKQMKLIASFDEQDGLLSSDFNFKAFTRAPNGTVYFGTKSGIISFSPKEIVSRSYHTTPVLITSLRILGNDSSAMLARSGTLVLNHNQNIINIGFTIPEYSKPATHTYRYKLEGLDDNWTYTLSNQPNANYSNLAPGTYKFLLQGSADGNTWSNKTAALFIQIRPAIWQRPSFWIIIACAIVVAAGCMIYRKIKLLIKKEREQHRINLEIATLELSALQAQMNPHFLFNTLNSIQHFVIRHDEVAANKYLSRFAKLMRLFLESSKNKYTSLSAEIELIDLYTMLEQLRLGNTFDYTIETDDRLNPGSQKIPSMLIQPFVENSIKHGLAHKTSRGYLQISFSLSEDGSHIICKIEDNGVGRKRSAEINAQKKATHVSRGMQLIEERIKTYNFIEYRKISVEIADKPAENTGTIIVLTIPIVEELTNKSHNDTSGNNRR